MVSSVPALGFSDAIVGPYVGGNVGGGWMSGKKSVVVDHPAYDDWMFDKKGRFGGSLNAIVGYRDTLKGFNMGGELSLGCSFYKQTFQETEDVGGGTEITSISTVKRDFNSAIIGMAGYDFGDFCIFGKLGMGVARFTHQFQEIENKNTYENKKLSRMSPALVTGVWVEKSLTPDVSLRAEYSIWIHKSINQSFPAESTDNTTIRQKLVSPKVQSLSVGAVWHF